ncbi:MAG: thiamine-phosphate kinase [Verrucomicrobia bacterium]|jgi:thiamine-monophosphate kinase|nr:thiamine-phosphate kinase [Verrucomicrobiota bacterium]MBT7067370.1 thiamine-phosphate kinase [Verrucomicrobiota bacterium]MBT7700015.1 thiamine-phosphate kinase [Verrucomicrobiota bacterium]
MNTLKDMGEAGLIERLTRRLGTARDVVVGPGDDCAVVRTADEEWLLTSDPVIEGVHFDSAATPQQIGHKALARSLSDIAAMGGTPRWALVDLVAPGDTPAERLDGIYAGLSATADEHGIAIVGGDVAAGPVIELHVFAVGSLPQGSAILRSGAAAGDGIYVTGALGGSRLEGHHLSFTPRLREGRWLRESGWATAMCDISDGLSTDLHHLAAASGVGMAIRLASVPCSPAARSTPDPLTHALCDGEDFELLFTVAPEHLADVEAAWQGNAMAACTRIGTVTIDRGVMGIGAHESCSPLDATGYDHFGKEENGS